MSVVAVVPAKDRADSVGATVTALLGVPGVDEVVVVDDGSTDDTAVRARQAGARVLRLPANVGKGGAVAEGVAAAPHADVYLLIDADVGDTAAVASTLLAPVLGGEADMTIGVLPPAGARGGFGKVRDLARRGIRRACGFEARAPLSGQRTVRGELLRSFSFAPRFGLEVGLTIDAVRAGARVVEVDVAMEHRHTGRSVAGFRHRGRQGADIVRALWPRLTTSALRVTAIALAFVLLTGLAVWMGEQWEPSSVAPSDTPAKVLLLGVPGLALEDVAGAPPGSALARVRREGAVAALFVRTLSRTPSDIEGYATLNAGTRVSGLVEGGVAARVQPDGTVVSGLAASLRDANEGRDVSSLPGAFGSALRGAGLRTGVVGGATAAAGIMDRDGVVDVGVLIDSGSPGEFADAAVRTLAQADVVLAEPPASELAPPAGAPGETAARALDALLPRLSPDTLLLVVSVRPSTHEWRLSTAMAWGAGVRTGYLHSSSTRREGLVTLTDVAPTVLDALGPPVPGGMVGRSLRYRPVEGGGRVGPLIEMDEVSSFRQRIYVPLTVWFVVVQALAYLFAIVAFTRRGGAGRASGVLRFTVLAVAAFPVATFVLRAVPSARDWGAGAIVFLLAVDVVICLLALRARRHPLSPLEWVAGLTVAVILVDVWTGARLQPSSFLGYSLQTAGRFTGLGNTTYAVLAATTVLAVCLHVHHAPRRREALVTAAGVFLLVVVTDGLPSLGSDVGGILSLVPVFGVLLVVLAARRLSWRMLLAWGAAGVVAFGAAAMADYARPVESRSHLGELVADLRAEGLGPLWTTASRKLKANLRTVRSPWTWTVPIISVYMLGMLAFAKGWQRYLPKGSALRAAALGILAVGLLGNVVNDSGIVVTAVVFVYLGPLLTLIALHHEKGTPILLEPAA